MNKHILKLLWNKRKTYVWIFIEQMLCFLVLTYCFVQLSVRYKEYSHPGKLNLTNVCMLGIIPNRAMMQGDEDWDKFKKASYNLIHNPAMKEYVEALHSGYYSVPENRPSFNNRTDSLSYNGQKYRFYVKASDDNFPLVFHPRMIEGTWFKDEILSDGSYPAIITKTLAEQMNLSNSIGVKITYENRDFRITGMMNDFKSQVFDAPQPSVIFALSAFNDGGRIGGKEFAVLVKKGRMNDFTNFFWKEVMATFPTEGQQPLILNMEDLAREDSMGVYFSLLIILFPTFFLTIFAFLGTFSLMYRQSKKAIGEYGLRLALGSTKNGLQKMVLGQSFLLTGVAVLFGSLFATNLYIVVFPEIGKAVFGTAVLFAAALMWAFAIVSVWYPARQASKTQPALALKREE